MTEVLIIEAIHVNLYFKMFLLFTDSLLLGISISNMSTWISHITVLYRLCLIYDSQNLLKDYLNASYLAATKQLWSLFFSHF